MQNNAVKLRLGHEKLLFVRNFQKTEKSIKIQHFIFNLAGFIVKKIAGKANEEKFSKIISQLFSGPKYRKKIFFLQIFE